MAIGKVQNDTDIWNTTKSINANDFYEMAKKIPIGGEVYAVNALTGICQKMIDSYDEVLSDQNEYMVELEGELNDLDIYQSEQNDRLQKLLEEIKALEEKEQNGTITEEEQKELDNKKTEYTTLSGDTNTNLTDKNNKIKQTQSQQEDRYLTKVKIAENYANKTIEKGTPLAETEVKGGFFRKLFGTTGKDKKEAGEKAVKVGNELLDNVSESKDIDSEYNSKLKKQK